MSEVKLKNGSTEQDMLVSVGTYALRSLLKKYPIIFYDLVMRCRSDEYVLSERAVEILEEWVLLDPAGNPHTSMRNIVLSAVTGDDLEMALGDPREGEKQ